MIDINLTFLIIGIAGIIVYISYVFWQAKKALPIPQQTQKLCNPPESAKPEVPKEFMAEYERVRQELKNAAMALKLAPEENKKSGSKNEKPV